MCTYHIWLSWWSRRALRTRITRQSGISLENNIITYILDFDQFIWSYPWSFPPRCTRNSLSTSRTLHAETFYLSDFIRHHFLTGLPSGPGGPGNPGYIIGIGNNG